MAGTPLHDVTDQDDRGQPRSTAASRPFVVLILLLVTGCAPLWVVPSLTPLPFLLLNLAYMLLACVAAGLVLGATMVARRTRAPDLSPEQRRWMLAAIITTGITLSHFQVFKQLVLPNRGFPLDPLIATIEQQLLFGRDAWEWSHMVFGGLAPTLVLDTAYALWLPIMFLFPAAIVVMVADARMRGRLIGTWVASWILIGSLAAWLLASAGPCYYNALVGTHPGFIDLHTVLGQLDAQAAQYGLQVRALYFQDMLKMSQGGGLVFASGISAMPSMHVAMATLFAIAGFKISSRVGWAFAAYALLIWIASIHLGWHYAADGILGGVMMVTLWLLSGPVTGLILSGAQRRREGRRTLLS